MIRREWRILGRVAALVVATVFAAGCFEYQEEINIANDGSGVVRITASIPEAQAVKFRTGDTSGATPPPVSTGAIRSLMTGSDGIKVEKCTVSLEEDVWRYNVEVTFDNIKHLARVRYFKGRKISLTLSGAKELHFHEEIMPSMLQTAKDEAKLISDDTYSKAFLAVAESPDFRTVVENAKLSYTVAMPGVSAVFPDGTAEMTEDNTVRATREFKMSDFLRTDPQVKMDIRTELPAERGFTLVVVFLLLASIVGILVPAIRLLTLKSSGAS